MKTTIRKEKDADLAELQQLFKQSITTICSADYDQQQIEAWTSGVENKKRWDDIMANQFVLVARQETKIVGFATLDKGNHLDLLYVHKDHQRQGIAHKLFAGIEKEAKQKGQTKLTVDASKTAKAFFEKMGFKILHAQTVNIKGVDLTNYRMEKEIG
jgi:putative acetyltransferase